ncbi:MAG: D-(-)-3-hydroxybutyrate oligomer hydrolase, partial [Gemmatimonadota bacterium]|nr:D-(-)-3-hydroxybutyrate oligomer hydrolase [Gemmatimonadota bacterium]
MSPLINEGTDLAMRFGFTSGQTLVQTPSPLTRLNYFDGKFLRADDLRREQDYVRQLVQFSNQGLGAGVVYGMDTVLDAQGRVSIGPGLAMDSTGRTLLIQSAAAFDIAGLIDASRRIRQSNGNAATTNGNADFGGCVDATSAPGDVPTQGGSLFVICIGHAESLCGQEDVYGRLCEEACITATDRPLIVEGVVVRALPLTLHTTLASSRAVALDQRHLRSLVASAFFEDERKVVACLISRAGLALDSWCVGAELTGVCCVPLAVVARAGTQTIFLDAWTARRERMEAPARRYWAWRMCMRPWDAYLAQILQFQCQLHEVLGGDGDPGNIDPCASQQRVLDDAAKYLREVDQTYTRHIEALSK